MIGRSARARSRAASSTAARSPTIRGATRVGAPSSRSRSAFSTSTGSERNTGPVGWANAVFAARGTPVTLPGAAPAGGLGIAVGHRDRARLLQREHVVDPGLAREPVHQRQ